MKRRMQFEQLVAASRGEAPPRAEVVDRVLASIEAVPVVISDRPLQWMAGLSAAAALLVVPSLLSESFFDPMGIWLSSLTVVMQ
jgi:hypothetical protein